MADRFISIDAAAERLDVCTRTVRRMIAAGDLPGYRLGTKAIRIRETDLEAAVRLIPAGASYG